jgi:hypothetical protein
MGQNLRNAPVRVGAPRRDHFYQSNNPPVEFRLGTLADAKLEFFDFKLNPA